MLICRAGCQFLHSLRCQQPSASPALGPLVFQPMAVCSWLMSCGNINLPENGASLVVHCNAGRTSGRQPRLSNRLVPDSHFRQFDSAFNGGDDDRLAQDPCNTFKADRAVGRKSELFDLSGVLTLLCRLVYCSTETTFDCCAEIVFLYSMCCFQHSMSAVNVICLTYW